MKNQLKIEYIDIKELKPNEYNPKKMSEKEALDLEKSITEFGIVDPLIVNQAKERKGMIIGGHQRFEIYKKLKFEKVPVIWLNIPDLKKEQELCLRLSKNIGSFDLDLLANLDEEMLEMVGFEDIEDLFTERAEIREETLKPFKKIHILISCDVDRFVEIQEDLEKIKNKEGIEYEQNSN